LTVFTSHIYINFHQFRRRLSRMRTVSASPSPTPTAGAHPPNSTSPSQRSNSHASRASSGCLGTRYTVCSCLLLSALVCSCLFLSALVCSCQLLSALVCSCRGAAVTLHGLRVGTWGPGTFFVFEEIVLLYCFSFPICFCLLANLPMSNTPAHPGDGVRQPLPLVLLAEWVTHREPPQPRTQGHGFASPVLPPPLFSARQRQRGKTITVFLLHYNCFLLTLSLFPSHTLLFSTPLLGRVDARCAAQER
jgi:hypothetical protein